ncbi:hypothetical protein ACLB1O_24405 [Escherichia coli]
MKKPGGKAKGGAVNGGAENARPAGTGAARVDCVSSVSGLPKADMAYPTLVNNVLPVPMVAYSARCYLVR